MSAPTSESKDKDKDTTTELPAKPQKPEENNKPGLKDQPTAGTSDATPTEQPSTIATATPSPNDTQTSGTNTAGGTNATTDSSANKKIKFSIGLENISLNGSSIIGTGGLGGTIDPASGFITDASLKQMAVAISVFNNAFLYDSSTKKYFIAYDHGQVGGTTGHLSKGQYALPYQEETEELKKYLKIVNGQLPNKNFKIGASFMFTQEKGTTYGKEYFDHFYPEIGFTDSHFHALLKNFLLNVELIIPTGNGSGKALRLKFVDQGPSHKDAKTGYYIIDVMVACMLLKETRDIFDITYEGGSPLSKNANHVFEFADAAYDYRTGELAGYGPEAIMGSDGQNNSSSNAGNSSKISYYEPGANKKLRGAGINGLAGTCRAKIFIDPENRAKAEEIVGKKLPDALFTCNATYGSGVMGEAGVAAAGGNVLSYSYAGTKVTDENELRYIKAMLEKPIKYSNPHLQAMWPDHTKAQQKKGGMNHYFGAPHDQKSAEALCVDVKFPDGMPRLSGKSTKVNKKIYDRFQWAWHDIWQHYSNVIDPKTGQNFDLKTIENAVEGIFIWGGCCVYRNETGSPPGVLSLHSWGTAFDIDPSKNPWQSTADRREQGSSAYSRKPHARLSHVEYGPFWSIWYYYGFYSFGIEQDNDWMHIQTAHW